MKYKIDISGMHCSGCKNLISMSLGDAGLENVIVDSENGTAEFSSKKSNQEIIVILEEISTELKEYKFSNLTSL